MLSVEGVDANDCEATLEAAFEANMKGIEVETAIDATSERNELHVALPMRVLNSVCEVKFNAGRR
jgi:hypothetical protein